MYVSEFLYIFVSEIYCKYRNNFYTNQGKYRISFYINKL
nr:MAG TPA: hypothetical protein [Caudoviricetes sp.]